MWPTASGQCGIFRTRATRLVREVGFDVKVGPERLSHHSHSFTADTYQHVIPGMYEATGRLSAFARGSAAT